MAATERNFKLGASKIELLILGCTAQTANDIVVTLRKVGIALHAEKLDEIAELRQRLLDGPGDLILLGLTDEMDIRNAATAVRSCETDAVMLSLLPAPTGQDYLLASQLGIRDIIIEDDPHHTVMVMAREFETLDLRRKLQASAQRAEDAEERCESLVAFSPDAIAYAHDGMHVRANPAYTQMFGLTDPDEIEGLPLMDLFVPEDHLNIKGLLRELEIEKLPRELSARCQDAAGTVFPAKFELRPTRLDGEQCIQLTVRNTERTNASRQSPKIRTTDPLTELLTRPAFSERINARFHHDRKHGLSGIVLINLVGFGRARTSLGFKDADARLKRFAYVLKASFVGEDLIAARYGDNTFAVYTGDQCNPNIIAGKARQLLLADWRRAKAATDSETICVGVADTSDTNITSARQLLKAARAALRQAEENGSEIARYGTFTNAPSASSALIDSELIGLINHALEHDGFRLKYQPIVSLHGDTREYYAVLLRLLDTSNVELGPAVFFEQAERANKLAEIDRWVVQKATSELAAQRRECRKTVFFVTLSHAAIRDDSFLLWICDCLRAAKSKGSWLVFQFDAQDLAKHPEASRHLLDGLHKINCRTAIESYSGTPAQIELLNTLAFDFVKLSSQAILSPTISKDQHDQLKNLANDILDRGANTVVSGVEDAHSLALLWKIGINYIQGSFLQEPVSSTALEYER